jgi:hypothetical protein
VLSAIKVAPSATSEGIIKVVSSLEAYCQASGQRINGDKSSIYFSKKCSQNSRDEIKTKLQVTNETLSDKYLGMPSDVGNSENGAFKYLKDRVWSKIKGWMEKVL